MKRYFLLSLLLFSCKKELNIADFSFNYAGYEPELRIEALILPHDSTAIVRIDKSYLINDMELYDCRDNDYGSIPKDSCESIENAIWHGKEGDVNGDALINSKDFDEALNKVKNRLNEAEISEPEGGLYY